MSIRRGLAVVVVASLVFAACGAGQPTPGGDRGSTGFDGDWWLVRGRGPEGPVRTQRPEDATMGISGQRVEGVAVCNSYGGRVEIEGNSFDADGFAATEMGCVRWRADAESAFLAALVDAERIERHASRLTLRGPSTELRFKLHRPPPPPELVGTRWKLNGLVRGRGPGGTVSSVVAAHLMLRPDGTMLGTTGCRDFDATWEEEGQRIAIASFEVTGRCDGDEEQDQHVTAVLGDDFEYEIKEQSMFVYEPGGQLGLAYTTGLR